MIRGATANTTSLQFVKDLVCNFISTIFQLKYLMFFFMNPAALFETDAFKLFRSEAHIHSV